jgi:hypothetical protein
MSEVLQRDAGANGGFFAVDRRIWAKVCVPGMMNEAIAYIVQARGTGRDNRTTAWSVESIERYTGISRHRAAAAIKTLQAKGFTRLLRGGTKPKYELVPLCELPGCDPRQALSYLEGMAVDRVRKGLALSVNLHNRARRAVEKGWLVEREGAFAIAPAPEIKPYLIWLPNELVDGAASEMPPLELVRQTQDPMTLRLLIDLYHAHNLREDGGVVRRLMRKEYERVKVGEGAQYTVWGFSISREYVTWEAGLTSPHRREKLTEGEQKAGENPGIDFFRRTKQLNDLGLIEWVPHLIESAEESGEIIHPLNMGHSESIEDRLGRAAYAAGYVLVTEGQYDWAVENGIDQLVPVPRHIANVQMVGIARLRYRPHTRMTAAWWAELNVNAEKHLAQYATMAPRQNTRAAV